MRTFASCLKNLNWHVFRRLENPHFFVSCAADEQAKDAELLRDYWPNVSIEVVEQPTLPEPENAFDLTRFGPYDPSPCDPSVVQRILKQLWQNQRVWRFFQMHITPLRFPEPWGSVVRCRPDLFFHRLDLPQFWYPKTPSRAYFGSWKATYGGVSDKFAIMGIEAADAVLSVFDRLAEYLADGCPLHPESLYQYALEKHGMTICNTLIAEFTVARMEGGHTFFPDTAPAHRGELARFIVAKLEELNA